MSGRNGSLQKYLCVCDEFGISAAHIATPERSFLSLNRGHYEVNEAVFLVRLNSSSVSVLIDFFIKYSFYVYLMLGDAFIVYIRGTLISSLIGYFLLIFADNA